MDGKQFDVFTRAVSSRRIALASLLGGIALLGLTGPEEAIAHNPLPACKKIKDAKKRQACLRRARKHNQTHKCDSAAVTCAGRCGLAANNCGDAVKCPHCPNGLACLNNGSCARVCAGPADCPSGVCSGGSGGLNWEGAQHCQASVPSCAAVPLTCLSTTDCPLNYHCQSFATCGAIGRCAPLAPG